METKMETLIMSRYEFTLSRPYRIEEFFCKEEWMPVGKWLPVDDVYSDEYDDLLIRSGEEHYHVHREITIRWAVDE